ncbi:MAG: hypothetical protein ACLPVI_08180 [Dehalococcoidales bacterium]
MQSNLDDEVSSAKTQLETLTNQGEQIRKDFISETIQFINNWYWLKIEDIIKDKFQITKQIGILNLSQMKKDIKQLQGQSFKIVNNLLQDQNLWWHLTPDKLPDLYSGRQFIDPFDKKVRLAAGQLALVLEKYNYLSSPEGEPEIWREYDSSGIHHAPNARPMYPYHMEWSEKMKILVKQYEDIRNKAYPVIESIIKLELEKSRKEAFDLWNMA